MPTKQWFLDLTCFSTLNPEDTTDFVEALDEADPQPVAVVEDKGKGKGTGKKRKSSSSKKTSSSKKPKDSRPAEVSLSTPERALEREDVLATFGDAYQAIIKALPTCLWPQFRKHGEHSYTVFLVQGLKLYFIKA